MPRIKKHGLGWRERILSRPDLLGGMGMRDAAIGECGCWNSRRCEN